MTPSPQVPPTIAALQVPDLLGGSELPTSFGWHCEPQRWSLGEGRLRIEPDTPTDFWQRTHYGIQVDNGHFLHQEVAGNFALSVRVVFRPVHQFDQAGIMVRISPECWLKSSVEFEPSGCNRLGAVVTNLGYSDWSMQDFPPEANQVWLRVRRDGDDYLVDASSDGRQWSPLRVAHLHAGRQIPVACGVYACSPRGSGFVCEFSELRVASDRRRCGWDEEPVNHVV